MKPLTALDLMRCLPSQEAADFCAYRPDQWAELHRRGVVPPALELSNRKYAWRVGTLICWQETRHLAAEIAVADKADIATIVRRHDELIGALPPRDQEFLRGVIQDAIRERQETIRPP
jgi:hypothetical protein